MEFKDFWSINGWLCQYYLEKETITQVIIVAPMDVGSNVSDYFQGWNVANFENWLHELDGSTVRLCTLPSLADGIPGLELRVFPCADGYFYAAYPASHPERPGQIYEIVWSFGRDDRKLIVHRELGYMHQLMSDAGRRIWLNISYLLDEASQSFSRQDNRI